MPLDLSTITLNTSKPELTPTWFHSKLTGCGKKAGMISSDYEPAVFVGEPGIPTEMRRNRNITWKNGTSKQSFVLLRPIDIYAKLTNLLPMQKKHESVFELYSDPDVNISIHSEASSCLITETDKQKTLSTAFDSYIYVTKNRSDPWHQFFTTNIPTSAENVCVPVQTLCLKSTLSRIITGIPLLAKIPPDKITEYLNNLHIYDMYKDALNLWNHGLVEETRTLLESIEKSPNRVILGPQFDKLIREFISKLEQYQVSLDDYREIYTLLQTQNPNMLKQACRENLNLRLSHTLDTINHNKPNLQKIPTMPNKPATYKQYSIAQTGAILSDNSLVLVQSAAGTGKSTVILGRMEHMRNMGIPMEDVLVLSFTNAAANHILEKEPNVHSSTIAAMIHSIYKENHNHELSNVDTLINSLEIWFDKTTNQMISQFISCLEGMKDAARTSSFTRITNFIENNLEEIIRVLDKIKQTTLELEIIITYLTINTAKEPQDLHPKHIIIDEVQDTSIFEFIFLLNYVAKHNTSLFMVGDCSQTLYEFRASNPKALNILESSNIFETHALQINYRSNQEILDFANISLQNIEANQYANLQLQANNIANMPQKSTFMKKVILKYTELNKKSEMLDKLATTFANPDIKQWINKRLQMGQKIAILSHARKEVTKIEETLKLLYPDKTISNLMPAKEFNSTIFSKYIRKHWDNTKYMQTNDFLTHLEKDIINNLSHLTYISPAKANDVYKSVNRMLESFRKSYGVPIAQMALLELQGSIPKEQFLNAVKEYMLKFEIQNNSVRQSLRNKSNTEQKNDTTGDFILSTIHSAKGLEFQNVIVIHKNQNRMAEDAKRMYYVAFTRATDSELILSYDTIGTPAICYNYIDLVNCLPGTLTSDMMDQLPITKKMLDDAQKYASSKTA